MGLFSFLFGCTKKPSADDWGLDQLQRAGDDLSLPHTLEFQLCFPTQPAAEQAALRIKSAAFEVAVKAGTKDTEWLCVATKTMILDMAALRMLHTDFDSVAASLGGHYNGWGMAAEKQN